MKRFLLCLLMVLACMWAANLSTGALADVSATSVPLSTTSVTLKVGESVLLTATVLPSAAKQGVEWARVPVDVVQAQLGPGNRGYQITALKPGTVTVTVRSKYTPSVTANCAVKVVEAGSSIDKNDWESLYAQFIGQLKRDYSDWYEYDDEYMLTMLLLADMNMDGVPELIFKRDGSRSDGGSGSNPCFTLSAGHVIRQTDVENVGTLYLCKIKAGGARIFLSTCYVGEGGKALMQYNGLHGRMRFLVSKETDGRYKTYYDVDNKRVSKSTYDKKYKTYLNKVKVIASHKNYRLGSSPISAFKNAAADYKKMMSANQVPKMN